MVLDLLVSCQDDLPRLVFVQVKMCEDEKQRETPFATALPSLVALILSFLLIISVPVRALSGIENNPLYKGRRALNLKLTCSLSVFVFAGWKDSSRSPPGLSGR